MVKFCTGKGKVKIFLVKLISLFAFCCIPPFGNGFWLQDLQAIEQSINKSYKFRKASREVSAVCKQTVVNLEVYFNYVKVSNGFLFVF